MGNILCMNYKYFNDKMKKNTIGLN